MKYLSLKNLLFIFLTLTFITPSLLAKTKIVGHRGASGDVPENTLEAVNEAWKQGALGVEIDITLTKDNHPILMHDDTLERVTDGRYKNRIDSLTLNEIQKIPVGNWGRWKELEFKNIFAPTLVEVLKTVPKGAKLFIEAKSGNRNQGADPRLLLAIVEAIKESNVSLDRVTIISFDHNFVNKAKSKLPNVEALYLTTYKEYPGQWNRIASMADLKALSKKAKLNNVDGFNVELSPVIDKKFVDYIHSQGQFISVWNYASDDTLINAKKIISLGVDYYMTNYPGKVLNN
jgi:glycerophosphoryl diester phosphodiesterase